MEVGSGLGHDARRTRPADVLVPNWVLGKPAAFDITVTSPLTPITLHEASVTSGSTAQVAENRKHMPAMTQSAQSLGGCVQLRQLRLMVVGVLKHRQTFLDLRQY